MDIVDKTYKGVENKSLGEKLGDDLDAALSGGKIPIIDPIVTKALNTFYLQDKELVRKRLKQSKDLEATGIDKERVDQEQL